MLVTIPDFSVTPTGAHFNRDGTAPQGIAAFNEIIKTEAQKRNLTVVDIYPLTQNMKNNPQLTAPDGLHPSAQEYALWEEKIFPVVYKIFK